MRLILFLAWLTFLVLSVTTTDAGDCIRYDIAALICAVAAFAITRLGRAR